MTCCVLVEAPDGSTTEARALLDSGSSVSERLAQRLRLPRSSQNTLISSVAGLASNSCNQSVTNFKISSVHSHSRKFDVTAVIVSHVTCNLPLHSVPSHPRWEHLSGITLADPSFGTPGRIDVLLGVEIFVEVMCQGRRTGVPGTPIAFETHFGWVLLGGTVSHTPHHVAVHHAVVLTGDDLLQKFWGSRRPIVSYLERNTPHWNTSRRTTRICLMEGLSFHCHGDLTWILSASPDHRQCVDSCPLSVRCTLRVNFRNLKQSFENISNLVMQKKSLHLTSINTRSPCFISPCTPFTRSRARLQRFVLCLMRLRRRLQGSRSMTPSWSVPPFTPLSMLHFRLHRVALTADVSRMYRAIVLVEADKDFHRFLWRASPQAPLKDFRMARHFRRVCLIIRCKYVRQAECNRPRASVPLAAKAVDNAFYVDDEQTLLKKLSSSKGNCSLSSPWLDFYCASGTPVSQLCYNT